MYLADSHADAVIDPSACKFSRVDVERLGFHAYKRAGIRTREFRALPPQVQEQLTGTTHAMLRDVYDEVPFEELAEAMARRRA